MASVDPSQAAAPTDNNPPLTITRAWLDQYGACKEQADLFEKLWPQGAVVTQDTLASAARAGLSLEWLAEKANTISEVTSLKLSVCRRSRALPTTTRPVNDGALSPGKKKTL